MNNHSLFHLSLSSSLLDTTLGTELVAGREAWVIEGEPRPGFQPHMKEAKFLPKFHGRVWIDKGDLQLAKMDVECLDTISWGVFLARFSQGFALHAGADARKR